MSIEKIVAENLRKIRKKNDLKQTEVAEKLGVTQQALSDWERGVKLIGTKYLNDIADLYGVSADEILGRTSEPTKEAA